jgi:hypothetical protein
MKRNMFGEARPRGYDEIQEAMDDKGLSGNDVHVTITHSADEGDFMGYSADCAENDTGDDVFSTLGYASLEDLRKDLIAAGITDIQEDF